jgi:hypothetical protein
MIKRSDFYKKLRATNDGTSVVTAQIIVAGENKCKNELISQTFDDLCDSGIEYVYGSIIRKLERLSRELPTVVMMGSPFERLQIHEKINATIAEIKTEIGMR